MTVLGAFRDDYYNSMAALPQNQYSVVGTAGNLTLSAAQLAGAQEVYISAPSGNTTATTYTTDTAANIIARLQNCVLTQLQSLGVLPLAGNPSPGIPNIFNVSYYVQIINNGTGSGVLTLAGGTGVTFGTGTNSVAVTSSRGYLVTVTGPNSVTFQTVGSGSL